MHFHKSRSHQGVKKIPKRGKLTILALLTIIDIIGNITNFDHENLLEIAFLQIFH